MSKSRFVNRVVLLVFAACLFFAPQSFALTGKQPVSVNGDVVEFKTEGREVVAEGNVEISSQDFVMTCDKVRVFIDEKIIIADGNVRFKKEGAEELEGEMIIFNFGDKTGTIIGPKVRMVPYYGGSGVMDRISDTEFILGEAEISTCDLPSPHWGLKCKEVRKKDDMLTAKGIRVELMHIPFMYLPEYSHRLTDKRPRFMITPGRSKKLGTEILGSWRYYLNNNARGLLHLDYYSRMGWGEGVDLNYDTKAIGIGNVKYYRVDQKDVKDPFAERKERSRIEMRHRWNVTNQDNVVLEYFRQSDANFRKDYFYREYERETNPSSFFQYSHVYPNATFSFLGQPRVNPFDTVLQKIPEAKLEMINQKIGQTPFYYKNTSSAAFLSNAVANIATTTDVTRLDTSNQLSYLFRFAGVDFSPIVGHQDTYYSRGTNGNESLIRGMFFSGLDVSTKLYKTYNYKTNYLNLNIDKIRHIITPTIQYRYQHEPTVIMSKIQQMDTIDSLDKKDTVTFGLENKLQTKRGGVSVDLARFLVTTDYNIERNTTQGKVFQNVKYDLELKPYDWVELDLDGEYDTQGKFFRTANADFWTTTGRLQTQLGYRFAKGQSNQVTAGFQYTLNPFWKVAVYERFETQEGNVAEQEYRLTRDLHCWFVEFIVNKRKSEGLTFLIAFKIKAFPEIGINAQKSFSPPRSEENI